MTTELAMIPAEKIALLKNTIAKGATDDELQLFLHICNRTGLDPFARQIHAVKRRQKVGNEWKDAMTYQIGIDGFRLTAERTNRYCPGREPSFAYATDGALFSATAYVLKYAGNQWHEVAATAIYTEYVQTNLDGKVNQMWSKMPHSQLAKCAEALALRRAFPAELSGLYTNDEMAQADNPAPAPDVIVEQPKQLQATPRNKPVDKAYTAQVTAQPQQPKREREFWVTWGKTLEQYRYDAKRDGVVLFLGWQGESAQWWPVDDDGWEQLDALMRDERDYRLQAQPADVAA